MIYYFAFQIISLIALKPILKKGKAILSAGTSNIALGKRLLIISLYDQSVFLSYTIS